MDRYSNGVGDEWDKEKKPAKHFIRDTTNEKVNPAQDKLGDDQFRQRLIDAGHPELARQIK